MTGNSVNGSGNGACSGALTLDLLAKPLVIAILQALAEQPQQQTELRRRAGLPAQTTLRAQLKQLEALGVAERRRDDSFPGIVEFELTGAGRELLGVAVVLGRWLRQAPDRPQALGGNAAKAAVKALAEGWSTHLIRALADSPRSLTELDRMLGTLSYPTIERRLRAMRLAGLIEVSAGNGRGTPYVVGAWLREATAPFVAAMRWERSHLPRGVARLGRPEIEAIFLLATPLVSLSAEHSGVCSLAAEMPDDRRGPARVAVTVEEGRVAACDTGPRERFDAWAIGSVSTWLDAIATGDRAALELGGDGQLAGALVDGLHEMLFAVPSRSH